MILESKYKDSQVDYSFVRKISRNYNIDKSVVKLMYLRGINTEKKIKEFLDPKLDNLNDPFKFKDMKDVVSKIKNAIENNKKILIYGDYDVDGMSATSILYLHLKKLNAKVDYFLPNRYVDGYGLTKDVVDKVIERKNPDLIITVDCGITSKQEVDYIYEKGKDIIVTDHHEPQEEKIPNCLIINPKMKNETYPFKELCGAGVSFKIVQAISGVQSALDYIDIASLATIADIVDLKDENRLITQLGIDKLVNDPNLGIKTLAKKLDIDFKNEHVLSTEIAFKIAPKINSSGRLGEPEKGLKLIIEKDKRAVSNIADNLLELNKQRQDLCSKIYEEAVEMLDKININDVSIIVLSSPNWDSGLLGITAAQIANEYNRPTIMFSEVDNKYKGSGRSINQIDLHKAISCVDTEIEAFGGHKMAAGLTVGHENYEIFKTQIDECVKKLFGYDDFMPVRYYDMKLPLAQISADFIKQINYLKPFGHKNEMPIFRINFNNRFPKKMKRYPEHLMFNLNSGLDLLSFNDKSGDIYYNYYKQKNALVELQINRFRGKETPKGIIKDIEFEDLNKRDVRSIVKAYYLDQLSAPESSNKTKIIYKSQKDIDDLINSNIKNTNFGTLIIINKMESFENYRQILTENNVKEFFLKINDKFGLNAYSIGLSSFKNINNFERIIFVDPVLNNNYLNELSLNTDAKIICLKNDKNISNKNIFKFDLSRNTIGKYYSIFKDSSRKKLKTNDIHSYFSLLKRLNPSKNADK